MFVDFSRVYVAVTYQAKPFFDPSTGSPVFPTGISRNFASDIDRPCSYRAVGGMGLVTSYS